jgi:hypothetical protein
LASDPTSLKGLLKLVHFMQVVDITQDTMLLQQYGASVPTLFVELGGDWHELRRQAPRLTADALALRIEDEVRKLQTKKEGLDSDINSETSAM